MLASRQVGRFRIKTGSRVGVVVGPDWELRVRPRLEVPQLFFLLSYARDPKGWRQQRALFGSDRGLFDAMAEGFSHLALDALERGVLRGYIRRQEQVVQLRGRIDFAMQAARGGGLPLPVHVEFDDFTANIPENRLLVTAAQLMLRLPRTTPNARRRLHRVRAVLDDVEPLLNWRGVQAPTRTRLNDRYMPAIRLAKLILDAASVTGAQGLVTSTTFAFDMNVVFEEFLETALREALRSYGGVLHGQDTGHWLDEARCLPLRPDLVWRRGGQPIAVLDAKYKSIANGVMKNADAYQMLAYCIAYRMPTGHLVYAKDSGADSRTHAIPNVDRDILVTAIDVELPPEMVLKQVAALADRLGAAAHSLSAV